MTVMGGKWIGLEAHLTPAEQMLLIFAGNYNLFLAPFEPHTAPMSCPVSSIDQPANRSSQTPTQRLP